MICPTHCARAVNGSPAGAFMVSKSRILLYSLEMVCLLISVCGLVMDWRIYSHSLGPLLGYLASFYIYKNLNFRFRSKK